MFKVSVVITVYNEVGTIKEIVQREINSGLANEIVIVDDGSMDGFCAILDDLKGREGVRVL